MPTTFLYSPDKSILANNPVDTFISNDDIEGFIQFTEKHKDKKLIGYLSYDIGHKLYNIKLDKKQKKSLNTPNIYFYAFKEWQKFNKEETEKFIKQNTKKTEKHHFIEKFKTIIKAETYKKAYKKIKEHIKAGDIYQINLTHRLESKTNIPAFQLFLKFLKTNPAEYAAFIDCKDFQILSLSPERFIKIENGIIETRPIKGTKPRYKNPKKDEKSKQELLNSPKETAELNMITDLLRNDIGKVSKIGTVKVHEHRAIQKCPSVWHTYSRITGTLKTKPIQAMISMLPGGSITGCPKKRAIEIIADLEATSRGIYTGIIGHIDPHSQNLDFNIAIRTIIKQKEKLYLHVGGGIVLDSKEEAEFQETLDKAESFQNIII